MRSIESYIREVILNEEDDEGLAGQAADAARSAAAQAQSAAAEAQASGEEIFADTTADIREIWSSMEDWWSGKSKELEAQARDIADEAGTIATTGMTRSMNQLLENEALLLNSERLEKIKTDVEKQLAEEAEAGVVISDNDLVNFRHGIRMMLLKDYADPPLTYPYRTAIYISAHRRNIETVTELIFDTLNYGMRAFLALPSLGKSIGLRKPAGGDPEATLGAADYAKYAAAGAAGGVVLKLGAEAGVHVGLEKMVKWFIQKAIDPQLFRDRVRAVLLSATEWRQLMKEIESGVATRESAESITQQFINYIQAYMKGVNYSNFIKSYKEARRLTRLFAPSPSRPTILFRVHEPTLRGSAGRGKVIGQLEVDINILDEFADEAEVDDFIREFTRRAMLRQLQGEEIAKGSLDKYITNGEVRQIMTDTDFGQFDLKHEEFAKILDLANQKGQEGVEGLKDAFSRKISSIIGDRTFEGPDPVEIAPGLKFKPATVGDIETKLTQNFSLDPIGSELGQATTEIRQGSMGMVKAAEALVTPTYTLTTIGRIFKFGRTAAVVTGAALTASLAVGGLAKFVEVSLLDSGDGIAYVPAALTSAAAAIRKDAFESFQETLDLEPDIDVLGIQTNVAGGNVNEGIFAQADEILLRLLEEPIGSDALDLGPDRMKKAADLYEEALRLTLEEWSVLNSSTLTGLAIGAAASLYLGPASILTGAASRAAMMSAAGLPLSGGAIGGLISAKPEFSSLYVDSDDDEMPDFLDNDPDGDGVIDVSPEEIKQRLEALPDDFVVTRRQMRENRRLSLTDERPAGDHVLRSLIKEIFRQTR